MTTMTRRRSRTNSQLVTKLHNYLVGEKIGGGCFADINAAIHSESFRPTAIKTISKRKLLSLPYGQEVLFSEEVLAPLLVHTHITPMIEMIQTKSSIFQVLEYMENGNLYYYMTQHSISYNEKLRIIDEVLSAVEYLHMRNICHRDIKLDNVLINSDNVAKLCDFGFATTVAGYLTGSYGSYGYAAPEVFKDEPYDGKAADMFSVGVLIYALFGERLPFEDTQNPDFSSLDFSILPEGIDEIERELLVIDPHARISATAVRQHGVFKSLARRVENTEPENLFPIKKPNRHVLQRVAELCSTPIKETQIQLANDDFNQFQIIYNLVKELMELEGLIVDSRKNSGTYPSLPTCFLNTFETIEDLKNSDTFTAKGDPAQLMEEVDAMLLENSYSLSTKISGERTAVLINGGQQMTLNVESSQNLEPSFTDITVTLKEGRKESTFEALCGFLKEKCC